MAYTVSTTGRDRKGPTLRDLLRVVGKSPQAVQVDTGVSVATVYRAMKGKVPGDVHLRALAVLVGRSVDEVRAAIERGARGAGGRARARKGAA